MRKHLEAFRPDVFHLFEPSLLGVGGIYYGKVLHVPIVISYHTNLPAYLHYYKLGFFAGSHVEADASAAPARGPESLHVDADDGRAA
jgi:hypothetical protein